MKTLKLFSLAVLALSFTTIATAQTKKETFSVSGNCGMCKSNIEKAAKSAGAKTATWDADTKKLTVTYQTSLTNAAKIQQKIAAAGYDNAGATASNDSYSKLHACCQYDRVEASAKAEGDDKMDCCKDGKCTKEGHDGKDCCKKSK